MSKSEHDDLPIPRFGRQHDERAFQRKKALDQAIAHYHELVAKRRGKK